jgi:hypothetical protein
MRMRHLPRVIGALLEKIGPAPVPPYSPFSPCALLRQPGNSPVDLPQLAVRRLSDHFLGRGSGMSRVRPKGAVSTLLAARYLKGDALRESLPCTRYRKPWRGGKSQTGCDFPR